MRASSFFRLIILAAVVVVVALWFHERSIAAELDRRLVVLGKHEKQVADLRAERDHLRGQLLAASQSVSMGSVASADSDRRVEAPIRSEPFRVGEWTPIAAWENEGRSTPRSTIATLLWAAAGGDLVMLKTALEFDDATRAKAREWFDTLPPATRTLYATPEDLIASVTIKNIPQTAAQLSWIHQSDAEHAVVGVLLETPEAPVSESDEILEPAQEGAPPSLANQNPNGMAVLNLRRSVSGWRVVVPAAAIDRIANELNPQE